jgi:hypothetical protein
MSARHKAISLSVLVLALIALAWWGLRAQLQERLSVAAQRDLDTIAEFVALDLARRAAAAPARQGFALLGELERPDSEFARTLTRVDDENFRRIYFFDAQQRIAGADVAPDAPAPAIARASCSNPTWTARGGRPSASGTGAPPRSSASSSSGPMSASASRCAGSMRCSSPC